MDPRAVTYREQVCARLDLVLEVLKFAKGISRSEVAERIGVSPQSISNWTSGGVFPDQFAMYKLCRAYGVTADYLWLDVVVGLPRWMADGLEAVSVGTSLEAPSS